MGVVVLNALLLDLLLLDLALEAWVYNSGEETC